MLDELAMAIRQRRPHAVIHRSEQRCQYTTFEFVQRCREIVVRSSIGTVGDAYDNAMADSFFATLEWKLPDRRRFATPAEARPAVFAYVGRWLNRYRRHSALSYESAVTFEQLLAATPTAPDRGAAAAPPRIHGGELYARRRAGGVALSWKPRADPEPADRLHLQAFNLIGDLTVAEDVELPLTYRGVSAAERRKRVHDAFEPVGMAHRLKHYPSQLSGGRQQRVVVARAVRGDPVIPRADDPTGNLDSKSSEAVMDLLRELHRQG